MNKKTFYAQIFIWTYGNQALTDTTADLAFGSVAKRIVGMTGSIQGEIFSVMSYHVHVACFDLILYVPSTIFQLCRDGSSWVEPVLSYD